MTHLLTFVHRSPYATWNSLQAHIRQEQATPDQVVVLHLHGLKAHARIVQEGIERLVRHYGGDAQVRLVEVDANLFPAWRTAIDAVLATGGPWIVDITAGRSVPTIAAVESLRGHKDARALYLDVEHYRYEPQPFSWVPYNIQTVRTLTPGSREESYRKVQFFGSYPRVPAMDQLAPGPGVDSEGRREVLAPWTALVVLLNEAGAAALGRKGAEGVSRFDIKIPHLGATIGSYDMERSRLRLESEAKVLDALASGLGFMTGAWGHDVPGYNDILEGLTAARILSYGNRDALRRLVHAAALSTEGPRGTDPIKWIGLDTNVFHLETITTIARERRIPLSRIPLVVSHVVHDELHHQMKAKLPRGDPPRPVVEADVHRPRKARLAHLAHEEFELLRSRSRMEVYRNGQSQADNEQNDATIVHDMAAYGRAEREPVTFVTNDRGCFERATAATGLQATEIRFGDPQHDLDPRPPIDKIAYLIYRLALSFGRVSLKGLGVDVHGDHPTGAQRAYLHEEVRIRLGDKPWTRGFLHEVQLKGKLDEVVMANELWL